MKVGYSLLLGHVADPVTLARIPLADPPQRRRARPPPVGGGPGTWLPVSKCTGSPEKLSHRGNTQTAARPSVQPPPSGIFVSRLVPVTTARGEWVGGDATESAVAGLGSVELERTPDVPVSR